MNQIKIVEVGPRDGLQNEPQIISIDEKLQFIEALIGAGARTIEVASFVRGDRIPQMANAQELYEKLCQRPFQRKNLPLLDLPCLVPNLKGLDNAQRAGARSVAFFVATSETFNQKNMNGKIQETMAQIRAMAQRVGEDMRMRAYLSTAFGCPYEGETSLDVLYGLCDQFFGLGVSEVSLGDTIGVANPGQVAKVSRALKERFDHGRLAFHFHDTRGRALVNIYEAYEQGFRIFDSSAGGLGGCPYAQGATGNVATEDVVDFFHSMGIETGLDALGVARASERIFTLLGRCSPSKVHQVILKKV